MFHQREYSEIKAEPLYIKNSRTKTNFEKSIINLEDKVEEIPQRKKTVKHNSSQEVKYSILLKKYLLKDIFIDFFQREERNVNVREEH